MPLFSYCSPWMLGRCRIWGRREPLWRDGMKVNEAQIREWVKAWANEAAAAGSEGFHDLRRLFIVELELGPDRLRLDVDTPQGISSDECGSLNRYLQQQLEALGEDWELEVGSPGLTTPLRIPEQFAKHLGATVDVALGKGKRVVGELKEADLEGFVVEYHVKETPEGKKRPELVAHTMKCSYSEPQAVTLVIGKR